MFLPNRIKVVKSGIVYGLLACICAFVPAATHAADSFSVKTISMKDGQSVDWIGQGKNRNFADTNKDKVTISSASTTSVRFSVETFSYGTIDFSFSAEKDKTLSPGLFYPAKRDPFRGSFNGIDVSGDGRGCNTILGGFYVHEYVLDSNGKLQKAAIDFVQYCEENTKLGLYGSLRYNSAVAHSCTANSCDTVKKNLGLSNTTSTAQNTNTQQATESGAATNLEKNEAKIQQRIKTTLAARIKSRKKEFPLFMQQCDIGMIMDDNTQACKGNYVEALEAAYSIFASDDDEATPALTKENVKAAITSISKAIVKTKQERVKAKKTSDWTPEVDIFTATIIVQLDIMRISLQAILPYL